MNRLLKYFMTSYALSSLIVAPIVLSSGQASAEIKKGTDASYVGAGVAAGVTSGGQGINDAATFSGNVTDRVKLGTTPFFARGNVLWSDNPLLSLSENICHL